MHGDSTKNECWWNTSIKKYPNGFYSARIDNRDHFIPLEDDDHTESSDIPKSDLDQFQRWENREELFNDLHDLDWRNQQYYEQFGHYPDDSDDVSDRIRDDTIKRAKDKLIDILLMNDFKWWVTVTFSDKELREDPQLLKVKFSRWLSNMVKRYDLHYVAVPELHKKGGVHVHMLLNADFTFIDSGTRLCYGYEKPIKIETMKRKHIADESVKSIVYNIKEWKYGFSTAIEVYGDITACYMYIAKYITKGSDKIFGKYYWSSRNIQRNPEIVRGYDLMGSFAEVHSPTYVVPNCPGVSFKYLTNITFNEKED